jgi:transposase-like protein
MMEKTNARRDSSTWREIVDRQVQSGSTVAEFCQREGLSVASFYGWRSKLRQKSDAGSGSVAVTEKPGRAETHASGFIDLGALGMRGPRVEVRLELGGGVALHLVRG